MKIGLCESAHQKRGSVLPWYYRTAPLGARLGIPLVYRRLLSAFSLSFFVRLCVVEFVKS